MLLRKVAVLIATLLLCLAFEGSPARPAYAAEEVAFQRVLKGDIVKVWVSPDFARDSTAFALAESWTVSGNNPEGYILYRSTDGGRTWSEVRWLIDNTFHEPGEIASVSDMVFLPDGTVFLSGAFKSGTSFLCKSTDKGQRWETVEIGASGAPSNLEAVGDALLGVFKLPQQNLTMLKVSRDGGRTWGDVCSGVAAHDGSVAAVSPDAWVAVLESGKVEVTLDGGKTWQDTGVRLSGIPAGPRRPGEPVDMIWGKIAGCVEPDGTKVAVACGPGSTGQVFVSRGLTAWERIDQAQFAVGPKRAASRATCVDAVSGGILAVGTPDGCVFVSGDYGRTWKPMTEGVSGEVGDIKLAATGGGVVAFALVGKELRRAEIPRNMFREESSQPPEQPREIKTIGKFRVENRFYSVGEQVFEMDVAPFVEGGRTFVPIRFLAYALGVPESGVRWDSSTETVTLRKGETTVELKVDSNTLYANGQAKQMDVTPLLKNDRVFLPARFVAEAFGYGVNWEPSTQSVVILE